jgi:hypothetical protein
MPASQLVGQDMVLDQQSRGIDPDAKQSRESLGGRVDPVRRQQKLDAVQTFRFQ